MFNFENGDLIEEGYVEINGVKYHIHMPKYNGNTPLTAENLNKMQTKLLEMAFPIGSTYITQNNTNPNTILNFGTWERLKGRACLGVDEDDEDFKTIGKTGGEKTHKLTIDEMASHNHSMKNDDAGYYPGWGTRSGWCCTTAQQNNGGLASTDYSGGDKPHNNMPPYEVVGYMWIRRS